MSMVYLGLGTNLGDRQANLRAAVQALAPEVVVRAESRVYETPAWGVEDQPAFLNMAVKAETALQPAALLKHLKDIERRLGRKPTFRWGPRLIDIDILFYDDRIVETPDLVIPHPRMHERAFVLVPLADIAAQHIHPVLGKTVGQLLHAVDQSNIEPADIIRPNEAGPETTRQEAPMTDLKPLNWTPKAGVGMTVSRRADGGMTLTFRDTSETTLRAWHDFALEHLLGSDRLTRNLYDLRAVKDIGEKAVRTAVEVNSDPSARNIRLAVVVATETAAQTIREIAAASLPETAAAVKIFTSIDEAETWLSRPLDQIP